MSDGSGGGLQVVYNLDRILDCHTHLTGMQGESAESILECMDFCGIEKVFLFAPMLDVRRHEITSDSLADIRAHNDYCADTSAPLRRGCWGSAPSTRTPTSPAAASPGRWT